MKHWRASAQQNGSISGATSLEGSSAASSSTVRVEASRRSRPSSRTGVVSITRCSSGSCVSAGMAGASTLGAIRRGQTSLICRMALRIAWSVRTRVSAAPASSTGRPQTSVTARVMTARNPGSPGSLRAFLTLWTNSTREASVSCRASARQIASAASLARPCSSSSAARLCRAVARSGFAATAF